MSMQKTLCAGFVLMAVPAAFAQTQQAEPAAQPAPPAAERKICRAVLPTGSIMAKRICLTRTEWAEFGDRNQKHVDMVQARGMGKQPEKMD